MSFAFSFVGFHRSTGVIVAKLIWENSEFSQISVV